MYLAIFLVAAGVAVVAALVRIVVPTFATILT
jgi:hypothetical protein